MKSDLRVALTRIRQELPKTPDKIAALLRETITQDAF